MRLGTVFRVICVALLVFAIVGEEASSGKGSPIGFQTEVGKMLDILINSLYTNRNIFLREIISNASDALDKIRLLYLTSAKESPNDAGEAPTMDIRILVDREKRQFIMRDGGVGMTKEELANNLGSLGTSGTKKFLETMKDGNDASFIGQFGVGFYSVFLVADKVRVASKSDDSDKQWVWESAGSGTYFLYEDVRGNTLGRGTELTMELKKDADEYLELDKIKEAIHKYSEFIHFPIYIQTTKKEKVAKAKSEAADTEDKPSEDGEVKDEKKEEDEVEEITTTDWELVNQNKPIWTRKAKDITEDEYNKFYKALTKDYDDPMYYTHFSAEGEVEFRSILFIPGRAPQSIFDTSVAQANIRLYVRRVFITDEFRDLLPRYLNFIKGVVDSDDLPLNVSREVLQESRILKIIKKKLVRKALGMLADIAAADKRLEEKKDEEEEKETTDEKEDSTGNKQIKEATYAKFWEEYGKSIRLGMIEDGSNRQRLTKLLRYKTSKNDAKYASLEDYVSRMPESQKDIYYISAESIEKIKQSPVLEDAIKRDVEVIYMTDAIDEYVVGHVTDFSGKKLINLAKEGVRFEDESKKDKQIDAKRKEKYSVLFKWLKSTLGDSVKKVILTKRSTSEAMILSSQQHDVTIRMAQIMRGQALGDKSGEQQTAKRVLEINHRHPVVEEIFKRIKVSESDSVAEDIAWVLYDTANLQSGFDVEDTLAFSKRVNRLLRQGVDIAVDAPLIVDDPNEFDLEEEAEDEADKVDKDEDADKKEEL